jgi:hypothetical protein
VTDYTSSGFDVRAVVGVAGSPSCGVRTRVDLTQAVAAIAERPRDHLTATWFNNAVVSPATCAGRGLFMQSLGNALHRRQQSVPFEDVSL